MVKSPATKCDTRDQSAPRLADVAYDGDALLTRLQSVVAKMNFHDTTRLATLRACRSLRSVLDKREGKTLQERWEDFEEMVWPRWVSGQDRPDPVYNWTGGVRAAIMARIVRPSGRVLDSARYRDWIRALPEDDPLLRAMRELEQAVANTQSTNERVHQTAVNLGVRILLTQGYSSLEEIIEGDLIETGQSRTRRGADLLDAALCSIGVFSRSPRTAAGRHRRTSQRSPLELVQMADIPVRFQSATLLYLQASQSRVGCNYRTIQGRARALGLFWRFIDLHHPEVGSCSEIIPAHGRGFVQYAIDLNEHGRLTEAEADAGSNTTNGMLMAVKTFFYDVCAWATEEDSPFAEHAPQALPIARVDLKTSGLHNVRRRQEARMTATVLDLEREMPQMRAYALSRWSEMERTHAVNDCAATRQAYSRAFWDWATLELLVQSGLRIEEARELTTLDILKRRLPDKRVYYMLHVKPSKFDRARVIPMGDGLGRVVAEIVQHIKWIYDAEQVPACSGWATHRKVEFHRAPYLLQTGKQPSVSSSANLRDRLKRISRGAEARRADGSSLMLRPHDCRRIFASEHLNNNTPIHVIQALLGHATPDTVMVYAKLYPTRLVEEYRKAVRGAYVSIHGEESLRNPTAEEWDAFEKGCSMRDMGTHMCALPTGEYCPKGLVCLGCVHAQPKKSAIPTFVQMLSSHERALEKAKRQCEPAGQIASREMEVGRIRNALRRAQELSEDVAAAIEASAAK